MPNETLVDARGHRCPVPTLRLRRAVERARAGEVIRLIVDDPLAKVDVPHYAAQAGLVMLTCNAQGAEVVYLLKVPS